jgi:hypothetical protein
MWRGSFDFLFVSLAFNLSVNMTTNNLISPKPIQLVTFKDDTWKVTAEATALLSKLKKPIKVVSIAGKTII